MSEPNRIPRNLDEMAPMMPVEGIDVYSWCPERDGKGRPTQVHVCLSLGKDMPTLAVRLKSARAVNDLIRALEAHRNDVWPGSGAAGGE